MTNERCTMPTGSGNDVRGPRDATAMLAGSSATTRLHAGELTVQDTRTMQAALSWKRCELPVR